VTNRMVGHLVGLVEHIRLGMLRVGERKRFLGGGGSRIDLDLGGGLDLVHQTGGHQLRGRAGRAVGSMSWRGIDQRLSGSRPFGGRIAGIEVEDLDPSDRRLLRRLEVEIEWVCAGDGTRAPRAAQLRSVSHVELFRSDLPAPRGRASCGHTSGGEAPRRAYYT